MTVPDGVLPVDKPEGPTSHDAVAVARRVLGVRRIGHTGTLDPFASGLLLLCVGRATRIAEYLTGLPKTYRALARLGIATDTDDRTGRPIGGSETWRDLSAAEVEAALQAMVGPQLQVPPAYSAKKQGGERMYERARRGEPVDLPAVPVTIHGIDVVGLDLPDVEFDVECSSGTYIRSIARDLGERLGTGGHLVALRRTRIGRHDVGVAVPLDRLGDPETVAQAWLSPASALSHLPPAQADAREAEEISHGAPISAPDGLPEETLVAVVHDGGLIAVAEARGGLLRPRKVFA
ncbi:MAG TPA: tRNA pseudouridine(55) synthase TruB [Longimicrobiales bacterium]|nr:tRNA pseudouridine(55) synthase TruB [Longimicrobiales bacterium]